MSYDTIIQAVVVVPSGEPLFNERATKIALDDNGAGLFVAISQDGRSDIPSRTIQFDTTEWPAVCAAINQMMRACEDNRTTPQIFPASA